MFEINREVKTQEQQQSLPLDSFFQKKKLREKKIEKTKGHKRDF